MSIAPRMILLFAAVLAGGCAGAPARESPDAARDRFAREFLQTLAPDEVEVFRQAKREDLAMFHFGAGSRIRSLYFHGRDSPGRAAFCVADAICDIDAESNRIVVRTWELVQAGER